MQNSLYQCFPTVLLVSSPPVNSAEKKESPSLTFPNVCKKHKKLVSCDVTKGAGVSTRTATTLPARWSFIYILVCVLFQICDIFFVCCESKQIDKCYVFHRSAEHIYHQKPVAARAVCNAETNKATVGVWQLNGGAQKPRCNSCSGCALSDAEAVASGRALGGSLAVRAGRIYNEAIYFPLNKLFDSEQVQDLQGLLVRSDGREKQIPLINPFRQH